MDKEKAIRKRIYPKIYDATYPLTKTNIGVFYKLMDTLPKDTPLKVLDLGCGYKPFRLLLSKVFSGLEYVGIDFSKEYADPDIILDLNKDVLPFSESYFDLVILSEVLEHLYNPMHCLKEVIRILRPGGLIFISTPFLLGNHDKEHDYYRYTDLFYRRFSSENGLEIIYMKKSGSILSAPFFILNLILGMFDSKLLRKIKVPLLLPIFAITNSIILVVDMFLEKFSKKHSLLKMGEEYLYFGVALVLRKSV